MPNDAQQMWLHDESKTVNVLPYTTLDSIKVRNTGDTNISNYHDFLNDYTDFTTQNQLAHDRLDGRIDTLAQTVSGIVISEDVATHYTNGLMSKEDKIKLDSINEQSIHYNLPTASQSTKGGIKVGNTLTIDGNGVLNVRTQENSLSGLSDTTLSNITTGQILSYNGTAWVNTTPSSVSHISDIDDVTISSVAEGQVLKYSNGSWVNGSFSLADVSLNSLSDINITTPTNKDYLVYNSTSQKWENAQLILTNATALADGLMSKEHYSKLEGIAANANNYVLPTASTSDLGGVKVDGTTITIDNNGVISSSGGGGGSATTLSDLTDTTITTPSNNQILKYDAASSKWINSNDYSLPTASTSTLGGVKVDGTTITINNNGIISSTNGSSSIINKGISEILFNYVLTTIKIMDGWIDEGVSYIQQDGITASLHPDGSIILNGTATDDTWIVVDDFSDIQPPTNMTVKAGSYFTACEEYTPGVSAILYDESYNIIATDNGKYNSANNIVTKQNVNPGTDILINTTSTPRIEIAITNGTICNNVKIYFMCCYKS